MTQSNYKLAFQAGWEVPVFSPAFTGCCPEHPGRLRNATVRRILRRSRPEIAGSGSPFLAALLNASFPAIC